MQYSSTRVVVTFLLMTSINLSVLPPVADANRLIGVQGSPTIERSPSTSRAEPAPIPSGNKEWTTVSKDSAVDRADLLRRVGEMPLAFECNDGDSNQCVRFVARGAGFELGLTEGGASLTFFSERLGSSRSRTAQDKRTIELPDRGPKRPESSTVNLSFAGVTRTRRIIGEKPLPGISNYFIGNDPAKWRTHVTQYSRVRYLGVSPGVDLVFYGTHNSLEYDLLVEPHADPNQIRIKFEGAKSLVVSTTGDLIVRTGIGQFTHTAPRVYQDIGNVRQLIPAEYIRRSRDEVSVRVGKYDHKHALVIDPVLVFSKSFRTGFGNAIAVDPFGNSYVVGETFEGNPANTVAWVTKLDATASTILYTTLLGNRATHGYGIAVDAEGFAVVTGATSDFGFPTVNAIQPNLSSSFSGGTDAFVTKLNPTGSALIYSTFLGGSALDGGRAVTLDSAGNAYLTGVGGGVDFPVTPDAFQAVSISQDAFLSMISPSGTLLYSTCLGGEGYDQGNAIDIDSSKNAYITGYTDSSSSFPTTTGALQPSFGGGRFDNFVARIATQGGSGVLLSETFNKENGGNPATNYSNFVNWNVTKGVVDLLFGLSGLQVSMSAGSLQPSTIETKTPLNLQPGKYRLRFNLYTLNPTGSAGIVKVRLAGVLDESLQVNQLSFGNNLISKDFDVTGPTSGKLLFEHADESDESVLLDNISLVRVSAQDYVTYLGGTGDEASGQGLVGIVVDEARNIYITGSTNSPNFPTKDAVQPALAGGTDAFISKMSSSGASLVYSTYLGGAADDSANCIGLTANNEVIVAGNTMSANFPLRNAIQSTFGGMTVPPFWGDAFVTKLNTSGNDLVYSTYLGGNGNDIAQGMALDALENVYVTGSMSSSNFPTVGTPVTPTPIFRGAFILKIPGVFGTGETALSGIEPRVGGNTGLVTVTITGMNFDGLPVNVKLTAGGLPEIVSVRADADNSGFPNAIVATFNLVGASPGRRDVEVMFSGNVVKKLPGGFSIVDGCGPEVWVDVIGPTTVRAGRRQMYRIVYGNIGCVDALATPIWIRTPRNLDWKVKETVQPPSMSLPDNESWDIAPKTTEDGANDLTPIIAPIIPAGDRRDIEIEITPATSIPVRLEVSVSQPLLVSTQRGASFLQVDCAKRALHMGYEFVLGLLPTRCVGEIFASLESLLLAGVLDAYSTPKQTKLLSLDQVLYGATKTALLCGAELVPHAKVFQIVVKSVDFIKTSGEALSLLHDCASLFGQNPFPPVALNSEVRAAVDPNEKVGSVGSGSHRYIVGDEPLRYSIYFENLETATAPAQDVVITDQLDPALMDLSTFSFGPIYFGARRFRPVPAAKEFTTDVDLRPEKNLIIRVKGKLDQSSAIVTWTFVSLDSATGLPTIDPIAGFLPPNVNPPEGNGNVSFTVMPKLGLLSGTEIRNAASITFDQNPAIVTPNWLNTFDSTKPASKVTSAGAPSCSKFPLQWSGADNHSGIRNFDVYVSVNGGPPVLWQMTTTQMQAEFHGEPGRSYSFFTIARDNVGNIEDAPAIADVVVTLPSATALSPTESSFSTFGGSGSITVTDANACAWSATSNASWINVSAPGGGSGSGTVNYTVLANLTTHPRSGAITVAGQTVTVTQSGLAQGQPVLISEENSTRALALDSVSWFRDPFGLNSPVQWGLDRRTRVILFALNFDLLPGENSSVVTAEAEDVSHRLYPLSVEHVGKVPGFNWLNSVMVRFHEDMRDIGDVLIRVYVRGVPSNRVRLGVGHLGGGLPNDPGSIPTPGRPIQ